MRHLDLDLIGRNQVFSRDAKTPRSDLLDFAAQAIALLQWNVGHDAIAAQHTAHRFARFDHRDKAFGAACFFGRRHFSRIAQRVFSAFARIAFATDAVHGSGQGGVRLGADRTQRHRTCGKAFDDVFGRLHLL